MHGTSQHTEAVLSTLRSALSRPVGDGAAPKEAEERDDADYPYVVLLLDRAPYWRMSGPFNGPQADKEIHYFLTSVGQNRRQTEAMADQARNALVGKFLETEDFRIDDIAIEFYGNMERSEQIRPAVYAITDIIRVRTTPKRTQE